jgi:uncharacterized protein (TIGR00725 family)
MELRGRIRIGVMGPSSCSQGVLEIARSIGRLIASEGAILICGGGTGVMEAAARGAKEVGGVTIGILPGSSASESNPHIDIPIVTGMGNGRNIINVLSSHAIIAVNGAFGTLSEIALAGKCGIPVVALDSWTVSTPEGEAPPEIEKVDSPEAAVAAALRLGRNCSDDTT